MFWRTLHDSLKWLGITAAGSPVAAAGVASAVAQGFPETKPWFIGWYRWLVGEMSTALFWIIGLSVFLAWLVALIYSAHKVSSAESDADKRKPTEFGQHHSGSGDNTINL